MAATPRKKQAPKKPAPLTLKGSKLEDFLPLRLAEIKLRKSLAYNAECVITGYQKKRPKKYTRSNKIRSNFLEYLIAGGCEATPIGRRGIKLIGAYIECADECLNLQSAIIKHDVGLYDCTINGTIDVQGASVKNFNLSGSSILGLKADGLVASGTIYLNNGFESIQEVRLIGATIAGSLDCNLGNFNDKENSLLCDRIKVNGSVFLNEKFKAKGKVLLKSGKIIGSLTCDNGIFEAGIDAQNIKIGNDIWLDGENFLSLKTINLRNSQISGDLKCENGHFKDANIAITANRAKIHGDVDLENVIAKGTIALTGTEIGGDFTPQGASLEGTPALQLRNTKIGGTLAWRSLKHANGEIDFSGASCATINTDGDSWMRKRDSYHEKISKDKPAPNETAEEAQAKKIEYNTKLDNFTYEGFSNLPDNCKPEFWIEFLNQQPDEHLNKNFKPRPWEQLASVLDTMGYQEEALELRIEKQKLQTNFMACHEPASKNGFNLWHWGRVFFRKALWGPLVGYGYKPGNALVYLFALIILGGVLYEQAAKRGIMTPTHPLIFKEARAGGSIPAWCAENWVYFPDENCASAMPSEYSEFQSFIYAADVALPVVNLRMEVDWAPRVVFTDGTRDNFGWWVRTYEWFLIAAGWILSLLFVSAVGSSIRK